MGRGDRSTCTVMDGGVQGEPSSTALSWIWAPGRKGCLSWNEGNVMDVPCTSWSWKLKPLKVFLSKGDTGTPGLGEAVSLLVLRCTGRGWVKQIFWVFFVLLVGLKPLQSIFKHHKLSLWGRKELWAFSLMLCETFNCRMWCLHPTVCLLWD